MKSAITTFHVFNLTLILLIILKCVKTTEIILDDDYCGPVEKTLELTLVQDVSGTYFYENYFGKLTTALTEVFGSLKKQFPAGAKFGYTTFSDYADYTTYKTSDCYKLRKELTPKSQDIIKAIEQAKKEGYQWGGADDHESSLTAVLYAAVDKKLKWGKTDYKKRKQVIKVIAVTTDQPAKTADNDTTHTGPPPKGDGSDTCKNGMPTWKFIGDVLKREGIFLLGLIEPNHTKTWEENGKLMGLTKEHFAIHALGPKDTAQVMAKTISKSIRDIPCPPPPSIMGNDCGRGKMKRSIEITLVQDVSGTYFYENYFGKITTALTDVFKHINKYFPGAKFGYTTFSDYADYTTYKTSDCYKLRKELTHNSKDIITAIEQTKKEGYQWGGADDPESSLTAVLYAAVDKSLKWGKTNTDRKKHVIKVIAVTTDQPGKTADNDTTHTGPPPKGDGSDTCNNGMPKWKFVGDVLKREEIFLIGLIEPNHTSTWEQYGKLMGLTKEHFAIHALGPKDTASAMTTTIFDSIRDIPCPPDDLFEEPE